MEFALFCTQFFFDPGDASKHLPSKSRYFILIHLDIFLNVCVFLKEVFFGSYDCKNETILSALSKHFSKVFVPVLGNLAAVGWGKLNDKDGLVARKIT